MNPRIYVERITGVSRRIEQIYEIRVVRTSIWTSNRENAPLSDLPEDIRVALLLWLRGEGT
jgi:hypothetical protein